MKINYRIYIPSKARSEKCHTANILNKHNINFLIVVEPQDYDAYRLKYGEDKILSLDKNGMGLSYSRNFIKNHSVCNGEKFHWQFDDDVKYFQKRQDNKNVTCNPTEIICEIENLISKYSNIDVAGLRDSVFAWTQKKFVSINKLVASCFLINNKSKARWSDNMIEDVDYCLQVLMDGNCTMLFNTFLYSKMPNNKDSGGQSDFMKYENLQKNLVAKYPSILSMRYDKKKKIEKLAPSRVWMSFKQQLKENL